MDNFNIDFTLSFIEKTNKKLIDDMENISFEYNGLSKEGHKLLQILNYSPKIIKPNREIIKNYKNIEIPQLSELEKLDYSKLDIKPKKRTNNREIKEMITNLLMSIIDDIIYNIEDNYEEKDDIEELKKIINVKKVKDRFIKFNSSEKRINEKLLYELKVFLFNKDDFLIINITPEDSIKSIKERIINKIIAEKDYEIKYSSEKDYDLRIMTEKNDKFNLGPVIEEIKLIFEYNIRFIAFLEKLYKIKSSKL